jgi:hypothetical protein
MRIAPFALLVLVVVGCGSGRDERERVEVHADGIYVDGRALTFGDACCYRPSTRVKVRDPTWSPDGARVALVIEDVGGTDLWSCRPPAGKPSA